MSIIEEGQEQRVCMAHLAIVGSHAVNGVAALHTDILKADVFRDFYDMWPEKFSNKTNGITPRRWLKKANPPLSALITAAIGESWVTDLFQLKRLSPLAADAAFADQWRTAKRDNKLRLMEIIQSQYQHRGQTITLNPDYQRSWAALAAALALTGRLEEAHSSIEKLRSMWPNDSADRLVERFGRRAGQAPRLREGLRLALAPTH